ncbi:hypothetical protein K6U06_16775 [Acidiferrimicrobium sp. IK]|uniref:hypothetical protein n=1 Tax=Acidiferrimicrobium sp. IK TaxID=2871700 RepID=UPI0021CB0F33|nr:hypothetical protein [Acidiferrimicrobium sp. IK]MCU4186025.1 hypothetical protein [Acidiferrimicrobium sp. IK]
MPGLGIDGDDLVVRLSRWEKFWAFHGEVRVPLSAVRAVAVAERPWSELRGWRSTGTGFPGVGALGTRRHGAGRDFVALRKTGPAVQVDLNGNAFERLVVSAADAPAVVSEIATAAGIGH